VAEISGVDTVLLRQTLETADDRNAQLSEVAHTLGIVLDALQGALPLPNR
jgi:hypothetical protein